MESNEANPEIQYTEEQAPVVARTQLYGFFSKVFGEPWHDRFEELCENEVRDRILMSFRLLESESPRVAPAHEDECLAHDVNLETFFDEWDLNDIRNEHREVFGLTISEDCPPHEVEYCEKTDLFYRSQLMADVGAFYNAFGLEISDEAPERVDHVRLELEFMQFLLSKRLYGEARDHDETDLETVTDATEQFFEEHVGWWIPTFGRSVEEYPESQFYARAARLLRWFCTHERLRFGFNVFDERPEPNVPDQQPEATCFECNVDEQPQSAGGV
ncbi:MAG: molecular chaperone [bacterium]